MASLKDEAPTGTIMNSAVLQHSHHMVFHAQGFLHTKGEPTGGQTHNVTSLTLKTCTLRCQIVAAVDASIDDIEAGHRQQHFCVACQVAQVLVQGNLLCCSSSLPMEYISATYLAFSSRMTSAYSVACVHFPAAPAVAASCTCHDIFKELRCERRWTIEQARAMTQD